MASPPPSIAAMPSGRGLTSRAPSVNLQNLAACGLLSAALAAAAPSAIASPRDATKHSPKSARVADSAPGVFAPTSVWRTPFKDSNALDSRSPRFVSALNRQVRTIGTGFATTKWSVPVYRVPADQPLVRVTIDNGNRDLQQAFEAVPVPSDARPADGTDAHLVVYQPSQDRMWEMFQATRRADGWHARYGGRILNVSTNPGYYRDVRSTSGAVVERNWWGATATSLPLMGGLITLDDLRAGEIDHAVSIAVPRVLVGKKVFPAQRSDGRYSDSTAIPEGLRYRLDPAVDVDKLAGPPIVKMIARAAQRYGLIVRDGGGAVSAYGEDPTPSGSTLWDSALGGLRPYQVLQSFPFERLQVPPMQITAYRP
jgi:hypothetical protein